MYKMLHAYLLFFDFCNKTLRKKYYDNFLIRNKLHKN